MHCKKLSVSGKTCSVHGTTPKSKPRLTASLGQTRFVLHQESLISDCFQPGQVAFGNLVFDPVWFLLEEGNTSQL